MSAPLIAIGRTSNPEAVRTLLGIALATASTIEREAGEDIADVPISAALFTIDGVAGLLIGHDFRHHRPVFAADRAGILQASVSVGDKPTSCFMAR